MRICVLLLLVAPLYAEPVELDFQAAIQSLATQNRDILSARKNLDTARFNYRAAYAGFLPQLTAGVNYTHGNSATTAQLGAQSSTYQLYSASLGVSQSVFSGLSDYYKVKGARASAEMSEAAFRITGAKAYYDLKSAWAQYSLALRQRELAEEIRRRRQDNLTMIDLRFRSGAENKGSLLLAESYRAQAERDVNQALRLQTQYATELKRVLNLPQDAELKIHGSPSIKAPPAKFDLEEASKKTPEYLQAVAQELSAEATSDQSISPFFPTVNASGSLFRQGPDFFPQGDRWSVNVGVSYPLFSGGKDYYTLKANRSALDAAKRSRESVQTQRLSRLQQALQTYRSAVENARVSESLVAASIVQSQIARVKYGNGLLAFEQWDIIETNLINRQKDVLQTRCDLEIAQAAWEQILGEGPNP